MHRVLIGVGTCDISTEKIGASEVYEMPWLVVSSKTSWGMIFCIHADHTFGSNNLFQLCGLQRGMNGVSYLKLTEQHTRYVHHGSNLCIVKSRASSS